MTPVLYLLCAATVAAGRRLAHVCAELRHQWGATPLLRAWWRR